MHKNENLNGAITGIAIAAAAHWARYDDDTQRRLRNVRLDAEEALDLIRDMQSRGEIVRSRLPTAMDAQVGLAIASPQPTAAAIVPNTAPLTRPDLAAQMETAAAEMAWPPETGQYDERGLVKQAGELTSMFLALTYEEVRAFVQGLAQSRPPSRDAKVQIFFAAQTLVAQLCEQKLTSQEYKDAWERLFGAPQASSSTANPHLDPARSPQVMGPFGTNVQNVVLLSSLNGAGSYANPNTDAAMRLRITASPTSGIAERMGLCYVRFGTEFKYRSADGSLIPFQPVVSVNSRQHAAYADNITSTGFALFNTTPIVPGGSLDVFIKSDTGLPLVS